MTDPSRRANYRRKLAHVVVLANGSKLVTGAAVEKQILCGSDDFTSGADAARPARWLAAPKKPKGTAFRGPRAALRRTATNCPA
jgi:hypothetical protein